jgi:preprotein translocase subunit YajC
MTILNIFNCYFTCINILLIIISVFLINYFILNTRYKKKTKEYILESISNVNNLYKKIKKKDKLYTRY